MRTILFFIFAFFASMSIGQSASEKVDMRTHTQEFQDFKDIKFGMFIHWGLYAVPAGRWKGEYDRGIGEWIMNHKKIPVTEYEQLAKQFNPVKFNAEEWAQLAEDAGMKYMVITSKHHDGFAMYGSKASAFNIVDATPYHKDPMKELSAACARHGIKFGFYYSHAQDWHEPNAAGNDWDFPEERNYSVYLRNKAIPQVKEILSNYGPLFLIWFDTPRLLTKEDAVELGQLVRSIQPACLVNSRLGHGQGDYEQMGDNAIPVQAYDQKWEVPATLNDTWGYKSDDSHWKEPKDLIQKLADIVSKGGNYLLNVGPSAEGIIPQESQKILREIGTWLQVNGESIYGTNFSPFIYNDIVWRCTTKPHKLYFHILNWPQKELAITGLESKVTNAFFLADGHQVKFRRDGNRVAFELPDSPVDPCNTVLVAEITDREAKVTPGYRYDDPQEIQVLYAREARLRGEDLRYDWDTQSCTNFIKSPAPFNELFWYLYYLPAVEYQVDMEYSCPDDIAGGEYDLRKGLLREDDESHKGLIGGTGGKFIKTQIGTISVEPGRKSMIVKFGLTDDKSAQIKVRKLILSKIASLKNQ